jgi:protein-tyrosine phosphatase
VQGISRSATIVIAYLMWYKRISYNKALSHVVKRRNVVNPNPGFREKLQAYEKQLGLDVENNDNVVDPDFDDIEL